MRISQADVEPVQFDSRQPGGNACRNDRTGRSPGNQPKNIMYWRPEMPLQHRERTGNNYASDATTVYGDSYVFPERFHISSIGQSD